ncbi:hypothetical protein BJX62DRAFT_242463 [Aspergillus germanicus]
MDARGCANEQAPYHWEQNEPQQNWRSRDHENRGSQQPQESPYSSSHNIDLGTFRGKQLSPSPSISRAWAQERPAPSPGLRVPDIHRPHTPVVTGRSIAPKNSFEDIAVQRPGYGYEPAGAPSYTGHHAPQQQAYTTSAESIHGCPPQLSVRKRNQRPRREMAPDERSVHLGEMNIPRMLASSGSTSNLMARHPEFDEYQPASNPGTWSASRYQGTNHPTVMAPIWDAPEGNPNGNQGPRSPFSRNNSVSSVGIDHERNFLDCPQDSQQKPTCMPLHIPGKYSHSEETRNSAQSRDSRTADENHGLASRTTEKPSSDQSMGAAGHESHEEDDATSPRKTSIGWLSEGRRVGYGYTLVPPEHTSAGQQQMQGEFGSPRGCDSVKGSPKGSKAAEHELADIHQTKKTGNARNGMSKTSESSFDLSGILQKLNLPRWTGTNFALKTSNNSDAGSCDSGGSSLFGIFSYKKKAHEQLGPHIEEENPWEFCSWVRASQSLGEQPAPAAQQDSIRSREHAEAQLVDKLATLRRRGGAWATKRKVSEIARNIERRAVAKLAAAAEQFPAVQRTATRVLRLKGPTSKDHVGRMHDDKPMFATSQLDGNEESGYFRAAAHQRTSSASSGDWDSLYEECLEERSIPE